jgi:hypothetical protein
VISKEGSCFLNIDLIAFVMKLKLLSLVLCLFTVACSTLAPEVNLDIQGNSWQLLGQAVDIDIAQNSIGSYNAINNLGNPLVGWSEYDGFSWNVYVKRWDGSKWVKLGNFLDNHTNQDAFVSGLDLDTSGNPIVSWIEYDGATTNIYVKRWQNNQWAQLGDYLDSSLNSIPTSPDLVVNSSGNPLVAWSEYDPASSSNNIYVKEWSNGQWEPLGSYLDKTKSNDANLPHIALDSNNRPFVSWQECFSGTAGNCANHNVYVKRWDGNNWISLGNTVDTNPDNSAYGNSLAIDLDGNPIVSWDEYDSANKRHIYVKRWETNKWTKVGNTYLDSSNSEDAISPRIIVDSTNTPLVAWAQYDGEASNTYTYSIYVKRWDRTRWAPLSMTPYLDVNSHLNALNPSLATNTAGELVVSWHESDSNANFGNNIYVKKYTANLWEPVGNTVDAFVNQSAIRSQVARKTNNLPVVAWEENDGTSSNIYVKQWTGVTWSYLGNSLDRNFWNNATSPSIALRSNNTVHVAWSENGDIFESFFNASTSSWIIQGNALDNTVANNAITPSLAIRTDNLPIVAFAEKGDIIVKQRNGNQWLQLGTPVDTVLGNVAYRPSLALKTDNNPIVAWYEKIGTQYDVYVKQWNGSSWVALGGAIDNLSSNDAKDIVLAIRSDNRPVVAWEEAGNIYTKRWNGSTWIALGGALDKVPANQALRPSIDLRSDNYPVVAWQETVNGSSYDVFVKRWTGSAWEQISTTAIDNTPSKNARRPSLILNSNNNPIVSWDELYSSTEKENVYIKQY